MSIGYVYNVGHNTSHVDYTIVGKVQPKLNTGMYIYTLYVVV